MRRHSFGTNSKVLSATLALAAALCALPARTAMAQEIQVTGPLAGAPAVRRMRQYRSGRLQLIVPTVGYTLQDQYARSLMTGLEANYHFTDWLGIGVYGAAANFWNAIQINTDLTSQVTQNGQTTNLNRLSLPSTSGFAQQVARLQGVFSAHVVFAPLRGKLALFQGLFVDTDFYIMAGAAAVFVQERADVGTAGAMACAAMPPPGASATPACLATQSAHKTRIAPAPMFGVGLNLYFNSFLGLALQWRAFPFNMNAAGTDVAGGHQHASVPQQDGLINAKDQTFYFDHMVTVGLIINLPTDAPVTE